MLGLDGLQSAGAGPRLGVPRFRDVRALPAAPPNSLPRPEAPSVVGTIPPTRRCWSASWERPDIRPTSAGPFDRGTACMRPCKLGAPHGHRDR